MSVRVEPDAIGGRVRPGAFAYLVTNGDGRSHPVALRPAIDGARLTFVGAGRTTLTDARADPRVTVVWPPSEVTAAEHSGYSLIADGIATIGDDDTIVVTVRSAVLHRPAP